MPQNKNFQKRITILDECFSSRMGHFTLEHKGAKSNYFGEDLIEINYLFNQNNF